MRHFPKSTYQNNLCSTRSIRRKPVWIDEILMVKKCWRGLLYTEWIEWSASYQSNEHWAVPPNTKCYDNQMVVFKQESGGNRIHLVYFNSNNKIYSRQTHKLFDAFESLTPHCIHNSNIHHEAVSVHTIQPACIGLLMLSMTEITLGAMPHTQCLRVNVRVNAARVEYDSRRPE